MNKFATRGQYKQIEDLIIIQDQINPDLMFIVHDDKRYRMSRAEATNLILLLRKICGLPVYADYDFDLALEVGSFAG